MLVEGDDTITLRRVNRPPNRGLADHLPARPAGNPPAGKTRPVQSIWRKVEMMH